MFTTILVDDSAIFRNTLKNIITARFPSLRVLESPDRKGLLRALEDGRVDLVFMDIHLSGNSGLKISRDIKETCPDTVVVILTNYDLPEYREEAFRCGVDHFLEKRKTGAGEILNFIEKIMSEK